MAASKKLSSAKLRAIASSLHREAASQRRGPRSVRLTSEATATGKGVIRFRASRVLEFYKSASGPRVQKLRPSKHSIVR